MEHQYGVITELEHKHYLVIIKTHFFYVETCTKSRESNGSSLGVIPQELPEKR